MPIDLLKNIIPPPLNPLNPGNNELWRNLETDLSFTFPEEYKACLNLYGSGAFSDLLLVVNPFRKDENYKDWIQKELSNYNYLKDRHPDLFSFPLYPTIGGLYPWAITSNGDTLYWEINGFPDEWPTIIYSSEGWEFERWHLSITEIISLWLSGRLNSTIMPIKDIEKTFIQQ